jgi:uncharacterized protein
MVVFDELHKMRQFKQWLKGWYDEYGAEAYTWVTGSGRLDLYQKGGDSLLGRYFPFRLHPLSLAEATPGGTTAEPVSFWERFLAQSEGNAERSIYESLMRFGGFPDPFLRQSASFHRRWLTTRRSRVTQEDIRDLTRISDIGRLEMLIELLSKRIASPLSINALREDLHVAFETARSWVEALERTYYIFTVPPYSMQVNRALMKAQKAYFWDWSEVPEPGGRLENFVASHLLKACHLWSDLGYGTFELWFLRDKEKREVDFLVTEEKKPFLLCECKMSDKRPAAPLYHFSKVTGCTRLVQIINSPGVYEVHRHGDLLVHVVSCEDFLRYLV